MRDEGRRVVRDDPVEGLMRGSPVTAGAFIVTVWGDLVVPRGGVMAMASLIALCDRIGLGEGLVRTAVSRLVAADRLEGQRTGRRSFYRLAPPARDEFAEAAARLYAPAPGDGTWSLIADPDPPADAVRRFRMAPLGAGLWIAPPSAGVPDGTAGLVLRAGAAPGGDARALGRLWDLGGLAADYARFRDVFAPLEDAADPAPERALVARLLLVHRYRAVLLRDPGLPSAALPADWSGHAARALFARLYRRLAGPADAHVPALLDGPDGPLPAQTPQTRARLAALD